jgi:hypothetical protein
MRWGLRRALSPATSPPRKELPHGLEAYGKVLKTELRRLL